MRLLHADAGTLQRSMIRRNQRNSVIRTGLVIRRLAKTFAAAAIIMIIPTVPSACRVDTKAPGKLVGGRNANHIHREIQLVLTHSIQVGWDSMRAKR